jgi:hypothetical protein
MFELFPNVFALFGAVGLTAWLITKFMNWIDKKIKGIK